MVTAQSILGSNKSLYPFNSVSLDVHGGDPLPYRGFEPARTSPLTTQRYISVQLEASGIDFAGEDGLPTTATSTDVVDLLIRLGATQAKAISLVSNIFIDVGTVFATNQFAEITVSFDIYGHDIGSWISLLGGQEVVTDRIVDKPEAAPNPRVDPFKRRIKTRQGKKT